MTDTATATQLMVIDTRVLRSLVSGPATRPISLIGIAWSSLHVLYDANTGLASFVLFNDL